MSTPKAAAFVALMFALGAALDKSSQAVLKELPLPWVVATLHFGAGLLWIFPAWVRTTEKDREAFSFDDEHAFPFNFPVVCSLLFC